MRAYVLGTVVCCSLSEGTRGLLVFASLLLYKLADSGSLQVSFVVLFLIKESDMASSSAMY